jgi:hypothetical protein
MTRRKEGMKWPRKPRQNLEYGERSTEHSPPQRGDNSCHDSVRAVPATMSALKVQGTRIVDEDGDEVVLHGAGLGGWMWCATFHISHESGLYGALQHGEFCYGYPIPRDI